MKKNGRNDQPTTTLLIPESGKKYRLRETPGESASYFLNKYGTATPEWEFEGFWTKLNGKRLCDSFQIGAALGKARLVAAYGQERGQYLIHEDSRVLYGKVRGMGEIVHLTEIEEIQG